MVDHAEPSGRACTSQKVGARIIVPGRDRNWEPRHDYAHGTGSADSADLFSPAFRFVEIIVGPSLTYNGGDACICLPTAQSTDLPTDQLGKPAELGWVLVGSHRNRYRGLLFSIQTTALWERIGSISTLLLEQFGALGLVAGAIGVIQYSFPSKWLRWILLWMFIAYIMFAVGYETQDLVGYLLPAIMVFAIWIGLSLPEVWKLYWKRIPIGSFMVGILVLSIYLRAPGTRVRVDTRSQDQPARYAEQLLSDAPLNAIVNTTTDQDTFPLWYYHFGLQKRADLRIVVIPLTQFVWYQETLVRTYPDLQFPPIYAQDQPNADWGKQVESLNPDRAVCNTKVTFESETGVSYKCSNP